MKKKILIIACLVILLTITGCGSKKNKEKNDYKGKIANLDYSNTRYDGNIHIGDYNVDGGLTNTIYKVDDGVINFDGKYILKDKNPGILNNNLAYTIEDNVNGKRIVKVNIYDKTGKVLFTYTTKAISGTYVKVYKGKDDIIVFDNEDAHIANFYDLTGKNILNINLNNYYINGIKSKGFYDGFLAITEKKTNKHFYINKQGKNVFGKKYDYVNEFRNGYSIVYENAKRFVIDTNGKEYGKNFNFKYVGFTSTPGYFIVTDSKNKYAVYDVKNNKLVVEPRKGRIVEYSSNGYYLAFDKKWNLYDSNGNIIYDNIENTGDNVLEKNSYYSDGLFTLYKKGEDRKVYCGYGDEKGNLVYDFVFTSCSPFVNGYASVTVTDKERKNYSSVIIDKKGNVVLGSLIK